jgi:capsular polysaccharide biosynthesis protein
MSFREQVGALAGAEVVLAPHGAGLSNLVFARPDAKVIELFSPRYVNPCYWKLACTLRLPYAYLIGSGERPSENDDPHEVTADITVAPQELESILLRAGVRPIAGS